jgi:hypothetical protein
MAKPKLRERFWSRVEKLPGDDACWLFRGHLDKDGYGKLSVDGRTRYAHIIAYELEVGPVPVGLTLDHLCRTRACARPSHLEPVTRGANVLRGVGITARNKRALACVRGHVFTATNTRRRGRKRICLACITYRKRRARMREIARGSRKA